MVSLSRMAAQNKSKKSNNLSISSIDRVNHPSHTFAQDREISVTDNDEDGAHCMDKTLTVSALEYTQPQTFTVRSKGGQFVSSGQPEILVDVPAKAVERNLNITMQVFSQLEDHYGQATTSGLP